MPELKGKFADQIVKGLRLLAQTKLGISFGKTASELARVLAGLGIEWSETKARDLYPSIRDHLRDHFGQTQYDRLISPGNALASAFAEGLKKQANARVRLNEVRPLLVTMDEYDVVAHTDNWIRTAMQAAGASVIWLICLHDDIAQGGRRGDRFLSGYNNHWRRRLLHLYLQPFSHEEARDYLSQATSVSLAQGESTAVHALTHGLPGALRQTAELLEQGHSPAQVIANDGHRPKIIKQMMIRYLKRAQPEEDKTALYAIALSNGNRELVRIMLNNPDNLTGRLEELEQNYFIFRACRVQRGPEDRPEKASKFAP